MMARAGSRQTFKEAKEDLKVYAGVRSAPKTLNVLPKELVIKLKPGSLLKGNNCCK